MPLELVRDLHTQDAQKHKRLLSREGATHELDVNGSMWQDHFLSDLAPKLPKLSIIKVKLSIGNK